MLGPLIFLFIFVPMIELMLLIKVGQYLGAVNTVLLVVFTGVLGATLARSQGLRVLMRANQELAGGLMPSEALFDGVLILIGGLLLLTPGLITDAVGFALLIPACRSWIKAWVRRKIEDRFRQGRTIRIINLPKGPEPGE